MNNEGTLIIAPIRPQAEEDQFPSAYANELKGGHHQVSSILERDNISSDRLQDGMLCTVTLSGSGYTTYRLENSSWVVFASSISGSSESIDTELLAAISGNLQDQIDSIETELIITISGSGNENYIPKYNADGNFIDSSILDSGGYIKIGLTDSNATIDLSDSTISGIRYTLSAGSPSFISVTSSTTLAAAGDQTVIQSSVVEKYGKIVGVIDYDSNAYTNPKVLNVFGNEPAELIDGKTTYTMSDNGMVSFFVSTGLGMLSLDTPLQKSYDKSTDGTIVIDSDHGPFTIQSSPSISGSDIFQIKDENENLMLSVADSYTMIDGDFIPTIADTYSLGTSAFAWKELYLTSNSLYLGTDKITTSNGELLINNQRIILKSEVNSISGDLQTQIDSKLETTTFAALSGQGINSLLEDTSPQLGGDLDINSFFIQGDLIPTTGDTYSLGTSAAPWKNLYISENSIYFGSDKVSVLNGELYINDTVIATISGSEVSSEDIQNLQTQIDLKLDTSIFAALSGQGEVDLSEYATITLVSNISGNLQDQIDVNITDISILQSQITQISGSSGLTNNATGTGSISVGENSTDNNQDYVTVFGENASADEPNAVVIGYSATIATGAEYSCAVGSSTNIVGANCSVFGYGSSAQTADCIIVGVNSTSNFGNILIGNNLTDSPGCLIIGNLASASINSVVIGYTASANEDAVSLGTYSTAGNYSVAVGYDVNVGISSIGVGYAISSVGSDSIVIGNASYSNSIRTDVIAIGSQISNDSYSNCVLLGRGAVATSNNQIVFGDNTTVLYTDLFLGGTSDGLGGGTFTIHSYKAATGLANTAGQTLIIKSGSSTGNEPGGSIIFKTTPAGPSGDSENTFQIALEIKGDGNILATGNISGAYFYGDGSNLTNLPLLSGGSGISSLVEDTTPQLGGNLDPNGYFINGDLIPTVGDTYSLGTSAFAWKELYLTSNSLYLGTDKITTSNGELLINNQPIILKSEVNSISGDLQTQIDSKLETTTFAALSGQGQVDLSNYLTISEIASISGNLQSQIIPPDNVTVEIASTLTENYAALGLTSANILSDASSWGQGGALDSASGYNSIENDATGTIITSVNNILNQIIQLVSDTEGNNFSTGRYYFTTPDSVTLTLANEINNVGNTISSDNLTVDVGGISEKIWYLDITVSAFVVVQLTAAVESSFYMRTWSSFPTSSTVLQVKDGSITTLKLAEFSTSTALSGASNTQIASSLAVKTYVDTQISNISGSLQTEIDGKLNVTTFAALSGQGITSLLEDTSPQLGGDLDINSHFIQGDLIPTTGDTYSLGTSAAPWKDLFVTQNTIHIGSSSLTISNGELIIDSTVVAIISGGGQVSAEQLDAKLDITTFAALSGQGNVDLNAYEGNIVPSVGDTFSLGTSAAPFKDLYLSESSLHLGSNKVSTNNGQLKLNDNPVIVIESRTSDLSAASENVGRLWMRIDQTTATLKTIIAYSSAFTWTTSANSLNTQRSYAGGIGVPSDCVIVAGFNGSYLSSGELWNNVIWSTSPGNLPGSTALAWNLGGCGAGKVSSAGIVAGGGSAGGKTDDTYEFDGVSWSDTSAPINYGVVQTYGLDGTATDALAACSNEPTGANDDCSFWNGVAWSAGDNLLTQGPGTYRTVCADASDDALVAGGSNTTALYTASEYYNGVSFTAKALLPDTAHGLHKSGSGSSSSGMIFGGSINSTAANATNKCREYNLTGNSWTERETMNTARYNAFGKGKDGTAIAAGGENTSGTIVTSTEILSDSGITIYAVKTFTLS